MSTSVRGLALLAALFIVGCGGDDKPAPKSSSGPRLPVAPPQIIDACAKSDAPSAFPVLCPTRWPSPSGRDAPKVRRFEKSSDAYLIDAENGFSRRGGHVFHLLVGGQAQPFGRWPAGVDPDLRLTTRKVTVPQLGGGTFVQQLPARRIATARVHGARAAVLQEPPYPEGGLHGGHVVVLWSEGGHGYLVSVHGERLSRRRLVAIALAMARSTRPSRTIRHTTSRAPDRPAAGAVDRAAFDRLEARRLRLPALGVDESCPLASATADLPGVPTEAALGPGGPTDDGFAVLRKGPVYAAFPAVPRILDFPAVEDRRPANSEWRTAEVLWVSRPSYDGPVLIRGRQLDGPERLGFGPGARPRAQLRLPAGSWMERQRPLRVWGRTAQPRKGWRMAVLVSRITNAGERGIRCYAFQVDGEGFSYTLSFGAIRQG